MFLPPLFYEDPLPTLVTHFSNFTFIAPTPFCFISLSDQSAPLISVPPKGPVLVTILFRSIFYSCEEMFQATIKAQ